MRRRRGAAGEAAAAAAPLPGASWRQIEKERLQKQNTHLMESVKEASSSRSDRSPDQR